MNGGTETRPAEIPAAVLLADAPPPGVPGPLVPRVRRRWRTAGLVVVALGVTATAWFGWRSGVGPRVVDIVFEERAFERVETHADELLKTAAEFDLDPCFMAGIMWAESRGRPGQVSDKSALGLMQLSIAAAGDAARKLRLEPPTREDLLEDEALNIRLSGRHLAWLFALEENEGEDGLISILVSYNAGRVKLLRWVRAAGSFEAWREEREAAGNSDVLAYARKVLAARDHFRERGVLTEAR